MVNIAINGYGRIGRNILRAFYERPQLKLRALKQYAATQGESWARFVKTSIMFDDNQNVINTLANHGLTVHNAILLNEELSA